MAVSKAPGALGRHISFPGARTPGSLGRQDGAAPEAAGALTSDTPGSLGRNDWGDPDYYAYMCRMPSAVDPPPMSLLDAHVPPRKVAAPKQPHKAKDAGKK